MKRIVFIGYIGKHFGDFLNELYEALKNNNIILSAVAVNIHHEAFVKVKNPQFLIRDLIVMPNISEYLSEPEAWLAYCSADMYILWNGYHGFYAKLRAFLKENGIPCLLCEYSSIEDVFLCDVGLHAESTKPPQISKLLDVSKLSPFINTRYDVELIDNTLFEKLKQIPSKKFLYLGLWDEAAGLTEPNSMQIIKQLSPFYNSSYAPISDIKRALPPNSILIIKPHPYCDQIQKKLFQELAIDDAQIYYVDNQIPAAMLIKMSDVIITITSTLSIVAAYYKKPVILLGHSYLSETRYVYQLKDPSDLDKLLVSASNSILDDIDEKWTEFFNYYLIDSESYSHNEYLNLNGVKSIKNLVYRCIGKLANLDKSEEIDLCKKVMILELIIDELLKKHENLFCAMKLRIEELVKTRQAVEERTKEMVYYRTELESRTKELIETRQTVEERTKEMVYYRAELESRTKELIETRQTVEERTKEMVYYRTELEKYNN